MRLNKKIKLWAKPNVCFRDPDIIQVGLGAMMCTIAISLWTGAIPWI